MVPLVFNRASSVSDFSVIGSVRFYNFRFRFGSVSKPKNVFGYRLMNFGFRLTANSTKTECQKMFETYISELNKTENAFQCMTASLSLQILEFNEHHTCLMYHFGDDMKYYDTSLIFSK